ncbi:uncharacterized protein UTRI_04548 [Ustilago trichophora]|uniref:Effector family protein Eff1 n=1 Tax=Ustilago trichophora TaxID=86804 RepID=A0A5C3EEM6_9BASI|nr:uncharacterized protein UTRI_04548 [Ustilago trichophora]
MFGKMGQCALGLLITLSILASFALAAPLGPSEPAAPIAPVVPVVPAASDAPVAAAASAAPAEPDVPVSSKPVDPQHFRYQKRPFNPADLQPIDEFVNYKTVANNPRRLVPDIPPSPQRSWMPEWSMPWSPDRNAVPSTKNQLDRLLMNPKKPLLPGQRLPLAPRPVGDLYAIKLPGNAWDSDALEEMLKMQKGREFYAEGDKGRVWLVQANRQTSEVLGDVKEKVNSELASRPAERTVWAPNFPRENIRIGQAKSSLGWMDRLTQGARRWFGSTYKGLKYLKPF